MPEQKLTVSSRYQSVNLRKTPQKPGSNVLAVVSGGQEVESFEKQGEWYKVRIVLEGYLHQSVADLFTPIDTSDIMTMPYFSQHDIDGTNNKGDCGFAALKSVLAFLKGLIVSVNELARWGGKNGWSTSAQLIACARHYGLALVSSRYATLEDVPPGSIVWIDYGGLIRAHVQDVEFFDNHWLIYLGLAENGNVITHDPDYFGARIREGAFKQYTREEFDRAWRMLGATILAISKAD